MRSKLTLFFLVLGVLATAQTKSLEGRVYAKDNDVTGVVIQNLTTERATISDVDGYFSIPVALNDTLVFSAVQFKRKLVPVTQALLDAPFFVVPMEAFVNELEGVTVNPYGLTGRLDSDVVGLTLAKDVSAEALDLPNAHVKIPSQSERKLLQATSAKTTGNGIVSVTRFLNAITGRTKMLKNRVKTDQVYARTQRVQQFYVDSLFVHDLKIPKKRIEDFMYYCEVDTDFQRTVDTRDKLKIWEFLVEKSVSYRKDNQLD